VTRGALDGLTVLELGQAFMVPYTAMLMQRLGADVIKVEPPQGEPYRRPTARKGVEAVQFALLNSGKRSLCLDLKRETSRELFVELAAKSDVILQNYAPGAFDRLVGIDRLESVNPRLIVASGSGYGTSGPYQDLKAMDLTIQAMSGVMSTTGFEDSPPVRTGPSVIDFNAGAHLFGAVMAALIQRGNTGRGQRVEVALFDAILPSLASNIGGWFDTDGSIPERTGNRHGGLAVAPYNAYRAKDGWVTVLCLHDDHWRQLCNAMDRPHLADDPEFSSNSARVLNMNAVDEAVGKWTEPMLRSEINAELNAASVPCAPVLTLREVMSDPQVLERGMLEHHHSEERDWWTFGSPLRLGASPSRTDNVPARLGQHNEEILAEKLHLDAGRIADLKAQAVI
jgi:crotonobetainyl-CoA:carnitine CoA-transferase CaiB-like acyl-CoA transferase